MGTYTIRRSNNGPISSQGNVGCRRIYFLCFGYLQQHGPMRNLKL